MTIDDRFRCICNPDDLFDTDSRIPRAVEGCPAHWVRYVFQQWLIKHGRPCCDLHGVHCEPLGDLCCRDCAESAHYTFPTRHADGSRCVLEA